MDDGRCRNSAASTFGCSGCAPGSYDRADAEAQPFKQLSVRNGPDLHGYRWPDRDGYADGTDATSRASSVIWCEQFPLLVAVARLEAT